MLDDVTVKIGNAGEILRRLERSCIRHLESPDSQDVLEIGALFGDLANNLRSGLNYVMRFFAEERLQPRLDANTYKKLDHDFPYRHSRTEFDKIRIIRETQKFFPSIYGFLESVQPYHSGYEWVGQLMAISNDDKHVRINVVNVPRFGDISALQNGRPVRKPMIAGNHLFVVHDDHVTRRHRLPCYFDPYRAYATQNGWKTFFLPVGDNQNKVVIRFARSLRDSVVKLIGDFEKLL